MRAKSIRSAGSTVTASTAAMAMAKFLEKARGRKSRPSWSTRVNTGRNATAMTRSEKKTLGPTSISAAQPDVVEAPGLPAACHRWILL